MRLNPRFRLRTVAGEHMIVETGAVAGKDKVFSLNEPAAWLWRKIGLQEFDEQLLVDWICAEFEVERSVAEADVRNMVNLWRGYDMLYDDK